MRAWHLAIAMATACAAAPPLHVDHVILAVADLDAGIAAFEAASGVRAGNGGVHAGGATQNALVSLGPHTYLELLAPVPGAATPDPDLAKLDPHAAPRPFGFAVAAEDVSALRAELARGGLATTEPQPGGRTLPSGAELHWITFGLTDPALGDTAPFFIHWGDPALHPARSSPPGCTLVGLELTVPDPAKLARLAIAAVRVHAGRPGLAITLRCGGRELRF